MLRPLFGRGPGERAVGQKLDNLLDVKLVILGEAVVAANLLRFQALQDIGIVRAASVLGNGFVQFRAGGRLKGVLYSCRAERRSRAGSFGVSPTGRRA